MWWSEADRKNIVVKYVECTKVPRWSSELMVPGWEGHGPLVWPDLIHLTHTHKHIHMHKHTVNGCTNINAQMNTSTITHTHSLAELTRLWWGAALVTFPEY